MKIRIIPLSVIGLLCCANLYGQNNAVTTGGTASGPGGSATYTIGQVFYSQVNGSSHYLIEGLQQPYEINIHISVKEYSHMLLDLFAYPNPTSDILTLSRNAVKGGVLKAALFDVSGKLISLQQMEGPSLNITMAELAKGTYFLRVSSLEDQLIKSFKILKN